MNTEASDPIADAVAAVEGQPETIAHDVTLHNGKRIRIVAPFVFGPDEFESAVAMLMEMRVYSEAAQEKMKSGGLTVPEPPRLIVP